MPTDGSSIGQINVDLTFAVTQPDTSVLFTCDLTMILTNNGSSLVNTAPGTYSIVIQEGESYSSTGISIYDGTGSLTTTSDSRSVLCVSKSIEVLSMEPSTKYVIAVTLNSVSFSSGKVTSSNVSSSKLNGTFAGSTISSYGGCDYDAQRVWWKFTSPAVTTTDATANLTWDLTKKTSSSSSTTTTVSKNVDITFYGYGEWNIYSIWYLMLKNASLGDGITLGTVTVSLGYYTTATNFTVDLSDYVGKEVWVGVSFGTTFNCSSGSSSNGGTLKEISVKWGSSGSATVSGAYNDCFTLGANEIHLTATVYNDVCPCTNPSASQNQIQTKTSTGSSSSSSISIVTSSNSTTAYVQNSTSSCYKVKVTFYYNKPSDDPNGGSSGTVYTLYENLTVAANSSSTPFGDTSKMTYNIASKTTC
jgi:hypothetical protein